MTLRTDHREFEVVQSGPDFLLLDEPVTFPAGEAVFSVSIDGEVTESPTRVEAAKNSSKIYASTTHASASLRVAE